MYKAIVLLLLVSTPALADNYTYNRQTQTYDLGTVKKYNNYEHRYETVKSPNAELKYDSYNHTYNLASPDAKPRLNTWTHQYEMASPDAKLVRNPYTRSYEFNK